MDHDHRYRRGIEHFNAGEFFAAHEEWEELWMDCPTAERRFYQSLIQAAVALYHWDNRNRAGARRLYESGRRYMEPFRPSFRGLNVDEFWNQVRAALAPALTDDADAASPSAPAPRIALTTDLDGRDG